MNLSTSGTEGVGKEANTAATATAQWDPYLYIPPTHPDTNMSPTLIPVSQAEISDLKTKLDEFLTTLRLPNSVGAKLDQIQQNQSGGDHNQDAGSAGKSSCPQPPATAASADGSRKASPS